MAVVKLADSFMPITRIAEIATITRITRKGGKPRHGTLRLIANGERLERGFHPVLPIRQPANQRVDDSPRKGLNQARPLVRGILG